MAAAISSVLGSGLGDGTGSAARWSGESGSSTVRTSRPSPSRARSPASSSFDDPRQRDPVQDGRELGVVVVEPGGATALLRRAGTRPSGRSVRPTVRLGSRPSRPSRSRHPPPSSRADERPGPRPSGRPPGTWTIPGRLPSDRARRRLLLGVCGRPVAMVDRRGLDAGRPQHDRQRPPSAAGPIDDSCQNHASFARFPSCITHCNRERDMWRGRTHPGPVSRSLFLSSDMTA